MGSKNGGSKNGGRNSELGGRISGGVFDAVDALESQEASALRKRRATDVRDSDMKRSKAAESQIKVYSSLVECRILLQRSLQGAAEGRSPPAADRSPHLDLMSKLMHARKALTPASTQAVEFEDFLVNSSESVLEDHMQSEYDSYREEWMEVLDRRHRDVRLHSGAMSSKTQFRVMDSTFWQQVTATAQHEELRREQVEHESSLSFDDTKVYQHLLKDFVASKSQAESGELKGRYSASNSASSSSNTKKKQVDRRASKGRKIRYADIPKLQNFTFPLSRGTGNFGASADLDENAWFRSLFGRAVSK